MAAMDFPSNPIDGQVSGNFVWSASTGAWKGKPSVSTTTIHSSSVPTSANPGDVWYNTSNGLSFTYFDDGTSRQWVEMFSSAVPAVNAIMPAGTIVQTARATAPDLWLLCQGQAVSRTTYATLYAAIGTSYGSGDGSTTFNIPDLQGRVPVGAGTASSGNGVTAKSLGAKSGDETVALSATNLPSHTHSGTTGNQSQDHTHTYSGTTSYSGDHTHIVYAYKDKDDLNFTGNSNRLQGSDAVTPYDQNTSGAGNHAHTYSGTTSGMNQSHTHSFTTDGGSGLNATAHNNMQPYIVLNYMIKV